ncbi:hypothetical protein [Chondromyces apiculatus]|uniref:Lipoprotein n=1 Tax=Chondromyces apiculatus DSM 436 TaxID=1192034 RepID=A0A017TGV8_9BACT|nr:hypothetical protein [Chondromyces apiculatus]EYF07856.1 Hypothetical protein CAP_6878 [Chondromyces apiculatus DSM 436]
MRFWLVPLFLPALAACAEGSSGALDQTQASPQCSPSDLVCAVGGIDAPIATGASLPIDVNVTSQGSAAPPLTYVSADSSVLTVRGVHVDGIAPGVASLLVMTGGMVIDFFHVWVRTPDAVHLHHRSDEGVEVGDLPGRVQLLVGDELRLSAELYAGPQRLLGEAESTWTSDAEVAQILEEGARHRRRLVGRAPGLTTVEVEALGLSTTLDVEVLP